MAAAAHEYVKTPRSFLDRHSISPRALHQKLGRLMDEEGSQTEEWKAMRTSMVLASCAFFAEEFLSGPPEAPYYGRFLIAEHHHAWDLLVGTSPRVCIQSARDHGKSHFFSFAYPLWQAIRKPNGSGFIFSATQPQAEAILERIKDAIETNPKLRWLYPTGPKPRWSGKYIKLSNGHRIYARGYGSKVRGGHPDWIVVDDGLNDEAAYSETVRHKQIEYYYNAISNMIVPGGQIVVVGTPFHSSDLYGALEKNAEYKFCRFKAENDDGTAMWPARYPLSKLRAKAREIGPIRYAREFLCQPISDEMSLFPSRLFQGQNVEMPTITLGMPREYWESVGVTPFMAVDFAISSNVGADYTVIWVMGSDRWGNYWIIDIFRDKGMPYQTQLSKILELGRKYEPAVVLVEANQMQRIFGDELIRTSDLPIRQHITGVEKHALDKGIPSMRIMLENGKWRIPRGDANSVKLTGHWIEEMHNFTYLNGKLASVGGHDDAAMASWLCHLAIKQGGFSVSFGDDVESEGTDFDDELDQYGIPKILTPQVKRTA
jgi:hypothetical protein